MAFAWRSSRSSTHYRWSWRLVWFCQCSLAVNGYVLAPLAWIMGVDWSDADLAPSFIGRSWRLMNLSLTRLAPHNLQTGGTLEVKTVAIISFALCGFANFGLDRCCRLRIFGLIFRQNVLQKSPVWFTGALAAGDVFNLMSATIALVLYWFSLSFIAGCNVLIKCCIRQSRYCK
ncbi:nucleoside transporter C-terminal domain-containing protein [Shigella flexneri]